MTALVDAWRNASRDDRLGLVDSVEFRTFLTDGTLWGRERLLLLESLDAVTKRAERLEEMLRSLEIASGRPFELPSTDDVHSASGAADVIERMRDKEDAELDPLSFDHQCEKFFATATQLAMRAQECMPLARRLVPIAADAHESVLSTAQINRVKTAVATMRKAVEDLQLVLAVRLN
jgi:hypothetical protein